MGLTFPRASVLVTSLFTLVACDDSTDGTGAGGATSSSVTTASGSTSTVSGSTTTTSGTTTSGTSTTTTTSSVGSSTGTGSMGPCAEGTLFYENDFSVDGSWPAPWDIAGGVETAQIIAGRARLIPLHAAYPLARMKLPGSVVNSESTFSIELENVPLQGMGFYGRQNGGYLGQTNPQGAGYAIFTAGVSNPPGIGSWFEAPGNGEVNLETTAFAQQSNTTYRLRVRIEQETPTSTRLRARIWQDGTAEPSTWTHDHTDDTRPELQNLAGGFAIDAWHNPGNGGFEDVFIDDLVICQL